MDKSQLLAQFSREPDRYYTVDLFRQEGFSRVSCVMCGRFFWTQDTSRDRCPDHHTDTYSFIGDPPTSKRLDYTESWKTIESFFRSRGHASISRYPVVCRWRPDLYYTIASIVDFQRVAGSVVTFQFPANPLVVPQTCLRFKDMEYVGVSGRHFSSFCMVGQHAVPDEPGGYWKDECIQLDYSLLTGPFGIDSSQITFVEDVWAGGGSFGPSLEYFVRGLELGNAVFTEFQGTLENHTKLDRRVIDMGAGLERFAWITMGTPTAYDCSFGPVMKYMMEQRGVDVDPAALKSYYTHVARRLESPNITLESLRGSAARVSGLALDNVRRLESIYMAADHIRTLIFAISDGSLPSNVGGGYNLRMMARRMAPALRGMDLAEVVERQIDYLSRTYPELDGKRQDIRTILDIEMGRYESSKSRMSQLVRRIREGGRRLEVKDLVTLYESDGITPDYLLEAGAIPHIPKEFYSGVAELHRRQNARKEVPADILDLPDTEPLYYDQDPTEFTATVLESSGGQIVLDRTSFYPRGGGQEPDTGTISGCPVVDVQKHGGVILHKIAGDPPAMGTTVSCAINRERRTRITKHHTATHILNAASRESLGSWVWQHSARKDVDHARLDITHHSALTPDEVGRIQDAANDMVRRDLPVTIRYMDRGSAEAEYGFRIYQGGVVPVKSVRIVSIGDVDVEACGGTHMSSTGMVGLIRIIRAKRIQDGVVRLEFTAGLPDVYDTPKQDGASPDHTRERARERAREVIPELLERIPNGTGSLGGARYGDGACVAYDDEWDERFHVNLGKKLVRRYGAGVYCGIFRSGEAVRVMVYCGAESGRSAICVARGAAAILGGRAAGDDRFAQGGGRGSEGLERAVSWAESEVLGT